jgi:hypothetical protein
MDTTPKCVPDTPHTPTSTSRSDDEYLKHPSKRLARAMEFLRKELHWSLGDFVTAILKSDDTWANIRRDALQDAFLEHVDAPRACGYRRTQDILIYFLEQGQLRKEIDILSKLPPFFIEEADLLPAFDQLNHAAAIARVEAECPLLMRYTRSMLMSRYSGIAEDGPLFMMLALISCCYHKKKSSGFQRALGVHLHGQGLKRRQLELVSKLGVCSSYAITRRVVAKQTSRSGERIKDIGKSDTVVTAYDNFEQMEGVSAQRLDNKSSLQSVTTGQAVGGIEIPQGGLRQDMLRRSVPMEAKYIHNAPLTNHGCNLHYG